MPNAAFDLREFPKSLPLWKLLWEFTSFPRFYIKHFSRLPTLYFYDIIKEVEAISVFFLNLGDFLKFFSKISKNLQPDFGTVRYIHEE